MSQLSCHVCPKHNEVPGVHGLDVADLQGTVYCGYSIVKPVAMTSNQPDMGISGYKLILELSMLPPGQRLSLAS